MNIFATWLTINRSCNLDCKWCYAQRIEKEYDMNFNVAKALVDISVNNGIKNFKLIGGEPTIYPHFFEILEYLMQLNVSITIVTNGIRLASVKFCQKIKNYNYPNLHFGISLKGSSDEDYLRDCGNKGYSKLIAGVKNCERYNLSYSLSYVLTHENINTLERFACNIKASGITKPIFMAYCNAVISEDKNDDFELQLKMDYDFSKKYESVSCILEDKLRIHQTFPLCMCEPSTYNKMLKKVKLTLLVTFIKEMA